MQRFISGIVAGIVATLVVLAAIAFLAVKFGWVPATADVPPPKLERWAAISSLNAAIIAGSKLYLTNCSVCHGTGVGEPTNIAKGFYIRAPQFVKHGVDDDPEGETYWKIEHGIRFTAMPSYKGSLTEEQIWQLTYFMKNLPDHLPPEAQANWMKPVPG
jgi:mono/diheme cytochrome c family protein